MVGINTPRTQIALPGQGIQELRETLTSLLDEFGTEDDRGNERGREGEYYFGEGDRSPGRRGP
jgi:hypothetical protein